MSLFRSPAGTTSRNRYSSTPIARTGQLPPFFPRLPLPIPYPLSTYLSISLAPRSTTARGTLTLMISSISGTSPLLVPFSWLSSAILRGILVHSEEGRRHFCLCGVSRRLSRLLQATAAAIPSHPRGLEMETGRISKKRTKHDGSSRNTDAARVALRSRRWRRLQRVRRIT